MALRGRPASNFEPASRTCRLLRPASSSQHFLATHEAPSSSQATPCHSHALLASRRSTKRSQAFLVSHRPPNWLRSLHDRTVLPITQNHLQGLFCSFALIPILPLTLSFPSKFRGWAHPPWTKRGAQAALKVLFKAPLSPFASLPLSPIPLESRKTVLILV